jgi:hypothetical protein
MAWTAFVLALGLTAAGQAGPKAAPVNFSGTWYVTAMTVNPKPADSGAGALPRSDETLTQTETALTIATTSPFGRTITQTFRLDGKDSTNQSGALTIVTRSRWVGSKLVTEGKQSQVTTAGYDEWTIKETRSLERGTMIVEAQYEGRDGTVTSSKRTYAKRKP